MTTDTLTASQTVVEPRTHRVRWLALAGVAYAVLQAAGDLTIGPFPEGTTRPGTLVRFYSDHHGQVAVGGHLLELSAIFLALFGVVLFDRLRTAGAGRLLAATALVGTAMAALAEGAGGATYSLLGDIGANRALDPVALQAMHANAAEFGTGTGTVVLLLAVFVASLTTRAVPTWLGWPAVVIALGCLPVSPVGFLASMLFVLWCLVAGVTLAIRR
jgi:hypothetical protein